jgi:radical SAM protein with 4Fe4S-binding SPASM domain
MKRSMINYSDVYDRIQEIYSLSSYFFGNGRSLLPLRYTLELTYKCNLKCEYCYIGKERSVNELNTQEWFKIIDQIPPYRLITLVGGEVLLRNDFCEILDKCLKRHKVNIVTNGTLLNDQVIRTFVDKKLLLLSVSIDGTGETHDLNRGVKGAFDKIINNLDNIIRVKGNKKYPMLDIKTTILENNLEELPEIYNLADYYKSNFLTLSFLKESNLQQNASLRDEFDEEFYNTRYPVKPYFNMEQFEDVYGQLRELSRKNKTRIRFYPKFNPNNELDQIKRFYTKAVYQKVQDIYKPCLYPWANVLITPEGNIYPCLSYKIGNIKDIPIKEVWNIEKFRKFRKDLKKNKVFTACQACCQLKVKC